LSRDTVNALSQQVIKKSNGVSSSKK
jgi:hypothetical protein